MSARSRKLLIIILFAALLFIPFSKVQAQTPPQVQIQGLGEWFSDAIAKLFGSYVNPQFKAFNQAKLPVQMPSETTNVPTNESVKGTSTEDLAKENSWYYGLGSSILTPEGNASTDFAAWIRDNVAILLGQEDDSSKAFVGKWLPPEAAANNGTKDKSFAASKCAVLPGGCITNANGISLNMTPMPTQIVPTGSAPFPTFGPPPNGYPVYFSQCDPAWGSYPSPEPVNECNGSNMRLSNSGCGPTSTAMLLATILHDSTINPQVLWDKFYSGGYIQCSQNNGGVRPSYGYVSLVSIVNILKDYNVSAELRSIPGNQALVRKDIMNTIAAGNYIIAVTNQYGGHFVVVDNITQDLVGNFTVLVNDPYAGCSEGRPATGPTVLSKDVNFLYGYIRIGK